MKYEVRIKKKVERGLRELPSNVQKLLFLLITDLQENGPIQKSWQNFSPLGKNRYHCHLNYRYVACWTCRKKEIMIEVYDELIPIESTEYWKEMEKNRIGNLLTGARLKIGLTQTQLAAKLDIRQNMVSDYERGRRTYSGAMARRLSKVLKVKEDRLKYGSAQGAAADADKRRR